MITINLLLEKDDKFFKHEPICPKKKHCQILIKKDKTSQSNNSNDDDIQIVYNNSLAIGYILQDINIDRGCERVQLNFERVERVWLVFILFFFLLCPKEPRK